MKYFNKKNIISFIKAPEQRLLYYILTVMGIILLLIIPKIYISNNIYYTSVEINGLKKKYNKLSQENRLLQKQA